MGWRVLQELPVFHSGGLDVLYWETDGNATFRNAVCGTRWAGCNGTN